MNLKHIDRTLRTSLQDYRPPAYPTPGAAPGARRDFVHMEGNTNLLGPNPAMRKLARKVGALEVNQYPSEHAEALTQALAKHWRVDDGQIVLGNGSDEVLDLITKTFVNPRDPVAFPVPSFVMYGFYSRVNLGRPAPVPLRPDFTLDVEGLLRTRARLILVASPNNPTGNAFARSQLERLLQHAPGLVVIDEAYAEYAGQNWIPALRRYPNLIVLRTFSKAFGLAALRVGYAVASPAIVERLYRAKPPYNITWPGEVVAVEALRSPAFVARSVRMVATERPRLMRHLEDLGFDVFPSVTNFVCARSPLPPPLLCGLLQARGILIKDLSRQPLLADCVRITVGTRVLNQRLLREIADILREGEVGA